MTDNSETTYLLAIETSGIASGVYVSRNKELLGQVTLYQKNIHSRRLSLSVQQLLQHLDLSLKDLQAIILSAGPGSFTGLRIGYSLAKGLAHASNLRILEIPTLDVWAYQVGQTGLPILSYIDAHREEIFFSCYEREQDRLKQTSDYRIIPLLNLPQMITGKTLISGGNLQMFREKFRNVLGNHAIFPQVCSRQAEGWALLALGYEKYKAGDFSQIENCEPLYLRSFKGVM